MLLAAWPPGPSGPGPPGPVARPPPAAAEAQLRGLGQPPGCEQPLPQPAADALPTFYAQLQLTALQHLLAPWTYWQAVL